MKQVVYFEHYPHYMGTKNCTIVFTPKEFETLIALAKNVIKSGGEDEKCDEIEEFIDGFEKKQKQTAYAMLDALYNYGESPKRPQSIVSALTKKGMWSGEWEEGSFAFATTEKKARDAVAKIEAKIEAKLVYNDF